MSQFLFLKVIELIATESDTLLVTAVAEFKTLCSSAIVLIASDLQACRDIFLKLIQMDIPGNSGIERTTKEQMIKAKHDFLPIVNFNY